MVRLLSKLPSGIRPGRRADVADDEIDLARARYTEWVNQVLATSSTSCRSCFSTRRAGALLARARPKDSAGSRPPGARGRPATAGRGGPGARPPGVLVSPIVVDPEAGTEDPRQYMT